MTAQAVLYHLAIDWSARDRDGFNYREVLDSVLFHARTRFTDYVQYPEEGYFPERLLRWLEGADGDRSRRHLFQLLPHMTFYDRLEMRALQRDLYRRVIVPWLVRPEGTPAAYLDASFWDNARGALEGSQLLSISESFVFPDFVSTNSLHNLRRPIMLGQERTGIAQIVSRLERSMTLLVLEDFVGSGSTAAGVLGILADLVPAGVRVLFAPLIVMEHGLTAIREALPERIDVAPVVVVRNRECLRRERVPGNPPAFDRLRAVVLATQERVCRRLDDSDDRPSNCFGYRGSGGLVVTCHNTPNNTLPLIHHRAPEWNPLFRRVHHSQDGLR